MEWDARVQPLAEFVEAERGLDFERAVETEFLSDEAWDERVRTDESELTDEDREDAENAESLLRALALAEDDTDIVEEQNDLTSDFFVAYYDPATETIAVQGDESDDLDVTARGTLVHELTHALQDQHFDIERLQNDAGPDAELSVRGLLEGDAMNVESAWVEDLSAEDQDEYFATDEDRTEVDPGEDAPAALAIQAAAPYAFGPALASLVDRNGNLDAAYAEPPDTDEHLFDPVSFVEGDEPDDVDAPALPDGATEIDDGEFGVMAWFTVLAERLDAHVALAAVDGWGGDQYRSYESDAGSVCVRVDVRGETPSDTQGIADALQSWIGSLPEAFATVDVDTADDLVHFESCDPGDGLQLTTGNSFDALVLPASRAYLEDVFVGEGLEPEAARCAATGVVGELTLEELASDDASRFEDPAFQQRVADIASECTA